MRKRFPILLLFIIASLIACSTPASTPTPLPPTPTITPTENPIYFDLTGEWYFLTGPSLIPEPATFEHKGELLTGKVYPSSTEVVFIGGRIDPLTLKFTGSFSASSGEKGELWLRLHGSPDELAGLADGYIKVCVARNKNALPRQCDWN